MTEKETPDQRGAARGEGQREAFVSSGASHRVCPQESELLRNLRQARAMIDLLLPTTDGGVLAQVVVVLIFGTVATIASRRHKELRLVTIGGTAFALALMGLRALH